MTFQEQSKSPREWGTAWKPQISRPVVMFKASMEPDQRSGPGRYVAFQTGPGTFVPMYATPVCSSIAHAPPQEALPPAKLRLPLKPKVPQSPTSIWLSWEYGRVFRLTAAVP